MHPAPIAFNAYQSFIARVLNSRFSHINGAHGHDRVHVSSLFYHGSV